MEEEKARQSALRAEHKEQKTGKKRGRPSTKVSGKGKRKKGSNGKVIAVEEETDEEHEPPVFQQPSLVTGAKLKPYQLEGLQWMVSLDQNGISGILGELRQLVEGGYDWLMSCYSSWRDGIGKGLFELYVTISKMINVLHQQTLQTIAFSAYLREQDNARPFLVVCPLSVLHNWVDEYTKFAPEVSTLTSL